jgi:hypothetical protein
VFDRNESFNDLTKGAVSLLKGRFKICLYLLVTLADTDAPSEILKVGPLGPEKALIHQLLDDQLEVLVVKGERVDLLQATIEGALAFNQG